MPDTDDGDGNLTVAAVQSDPGYEAEATVLARDIRNVWCTLPLEDRKIVSGLWTDNDGMIIHALAMFNHSDTRSKLAGVTPDGSYFFMHGKLIRKAPENVRHILAAHEFGHLLHEAIMARLLASPMGSLAKDVELMVCCRDREFFADRAAEIWNHDPKNLDGWMRQNSGFIDELSEPLF